MSILALTSDTLVGTAGAGQIEYNGQFFGTDSNASRAQLQRIVQETAQATTSGTSKDFTGIPAWVKRVTVMFNGVSLNSTAYILVQIGDSGGVETSGYSSVSNYFTTATAAPATSTAGFVINNVGTAAQLISGHLVLTLLNPATYLWVASGTFIGTGTYNQTAITGGSKTLSDVIDRVRITSTSTDTFDAGSINILYEG
jgi:hypothetical protein